jgi:replicative DNA helicase
MTTVYDDAPPPTEPGWLDDEEPTRTGANARRVPHDLAAEDAVLGACLRSKQAIADVIDEGLQPADFYRPANGHIFAAVLNLYGAGEPVDPVLVADRLRTADLLDMVGGPAALSGIAERTPATSSAAHYAHIVVRHARWGRAIAAAGEIAEMYYRHPDDEDAADLRAVELITRAVTPPSSPNNIKRHAVDGATFLLETPSTITALWGEDDRVAWAEGEALMLCGPSGVGKTTIVQQLVLARAGIGPTRFLGLPVAIDDRKILYIAADRPAQARRSMQRMVTPEDYYTLQQQFVFWPGPPPCDIVKDPSSLLRFAEAHDAGTVVIDSLKDLAPGLAKDEVGAAYNIARQHVLAEGIEVIENHHQRKSGSDGGKPKTLSDVYGSVWLVNGAGSVFVIWGESGDPIVEWLHLKQPMEQIGPHKILHDAHAGVSQLHQAFDLLDTLRKCSAGMTVTSAARLIFEKTDPTDAQREKARRQMQSLERKGLAYCNKGAGTDLYFATTNREEPAA